MTGGVSGGFGFESRGGVTGGVGVAGVVAEGIGRSFSEGTCSASGGLRSAVRIGAISGSLLERRDGTTIAWPGAA